MIINSNINILGGLPDLNLVAYFLPEEGKSSVSQADHHAFTAIKTGKSVWRFEKAITSTFLKFANSDLEILVRSVLRGESITNDSLLLLFWNASLNNDLLRYLNEQIYFVAFYSGRITIKQDEVIACIKDLRDTESYLENWSDSTIKTTSSKYLTLLKKFGLMEGVMNKKILHPYLNNKMFVLFIYWLKAVEAKPNILESDWIKYSFSEKAAFVERVMQKRFAKYFQISYTGDKLKRETSIPYDSIYDALK
jgi:hypothetical protein